MLRPSESEKSALVDVWVPGAARGALVAVSSADAGCTKRRGWNRADGMRRHRRHDR